MTDTPAPDELLFVSYARDDSAFVLELVKRLRDAGVPVWLDQLDIPAGERWDRSIGEALERSRHMLLVLSPDSVGSVNVMDEVSYALDEGMRITPILHRECKVPFRLRRLQHIDFVGDDDEDAIRRLLVELGREAPAPAPRSPRTGVVARSGPGRGALWGVAVAAGLALVAAVAVRVAMGPEADPDEEPVYLAPLGEGGVASLATSADPGPDRPGVEEASSAPVGEAALGGLSPSMQHGQPTGTSSPTPGPTSTTSLGTTATPAGLGTQDDDGDQDITTPGPDDGDQLTPAPPFALRSALAREVSRDHAGFVERFEARLDGATEASTALVTYRTGVAGWTSAPMKATAAGVWAVEVPIARSYALGKLKWYVQARERASAEPASFGSREEPQSHPINLVFPPDPAEVEDAEPTPSPWTSAIAVCGKGPAGEPGIAAAFNQELLTDLLRTTAPCDDAKARWVLTTELTVVDGSSSWEGWAGCEVRAALALKDRGGAGSQTGAVTSGMRSHKDEREAVCGKQAAAAAYEAKSWLALKTQ